MPKTGAVPIRDMILMSITATEKLEKSDFAETKNSTVKMFGCTNV